MKAMLRKKICFKSLSLLIYANFLFCIPSLAQQTAELPANIITEKNDFVNVFPVVSKTEQIIQY